MTERALTEIDAQACTRWRLKASLIVYRFGVLKPGEQIMMVATGASHRQAAFEAAGFLMDFLKSRAPFWKKNMALPGLNGWMPRNRTRRR